MKTKVCSATRLKPGESFFMAGVLYRIVHVEETHDALGHPIASIQIYDPDQGGPARFLYSYLRVPRRTVFQVLTME